MALERFMYVVRTICVFREYLKNHNCQNNGIKNNPEKYTRAKGQKARMTVVILRKSPRWILQVGIIIAI